MKNWNTPEIEEVVFSETAHGGDSWTIIDNTWTDKDGQIVDEFGTQS
ncbi:MAG: hypothetical protein IJR29_03510 [Butyrivibrio sp.]|nr:hypothetical protein [Butyrivibrio sp.]